MSDRDQGDFDPADYPTEIMTHWHNSFLAAKIPPEPSRATDLGRAKLDELMRDCVARTKLVGAARTDEREKLRDILAWSDTPDLYRKTFVWIAGLPTGVVGKKDRDLTEREKELLRAAVADLAMHAIKLRGVL